MPSECSLTRFPSHYKSRPAGQFLDRSIKSVYGSHPVSLPPVYGNRDNTSSMQRPTSNGNVMEPVTTKHISILVLPPVTSSDRLENGLVAHSISRYSWPATMALGDCIDRRVVFTREACASVYAILMKALHLRTTGSVSPASISGTCQRQKCQNTKLPLSIYDIEF